MEKNHLNISNQSEKNDPIENDARKVYIKPVLELLGDLRSITLGGSPQTFVDSFLGPFP